MDAVAKGSADGWEENSSDNTMSSAVRQLRIKTGVVKRLAKDHVYYQKEAEKQRERIAKMEADGVDPYDVKKQVEVLEDTLNMLPDTKKRLEQAYNELKALMDDPSCANTEELTAAKTMLEQTDLPLA